MRIKEHIHESRLNIFLLRHGSNNRQNFIPHRPTRLRRHLLRSDLQVKTPATDGVVLSVILPGEARPRKVYVAYHEVPAYGDPGQDPGCILGYEAARLDIDGVLDDDTDEVLAPTPQQEAEIRRALEAEVWT